MSKSNQTTEHPEKTHQKKDPDVKKLVDENGEPVISNDDPDIVPPPEEELETTPPYEPPSPAEGP